MTGELPTIRATRRFMLAASGAAAAIAARPALAQRGLTFGPPPHPKGPLVFRDYDQVELDAAYNQLVYEPNLPQVSARLTSNSALVRARLGPPDRRAYGPTDVEKLDIYRTRQPNAPIVVYIHGGEWRAGSASGSAFPAEVFVNAGVHYIAVDYVPVQDVGGDLTKLADQVRRVVGFVYRNAASFGGDPGRIHVVGHSAGGHLAAVVLTTDWHGAYGLPPDVVRGGVCISGMYDLGPVALSSRRLYVKFDDAVIQALSAQRNIGRLTAPIIVAYGTFETPEFQRQARDFAAAVKQAGKPVQLLVGENYAHLEMDESLGNPYGLMGRAVLDQIHQP